MTPPGSIAERPHLDEAVGNRSWEWLAALAQRLRVELQLVDPQFNPVSLPPLRDRREDIPLLVSTLLTDMNRKHGTRITDVEPNVKEALCAYHWPGNVRELRNVVERSSIVAGEGTIRMEHLPPGLGHGAPAARAAAALVEQVGDSANREELRIPVGSTIEQTERALIELTLDHTKNNKTRAAEILGISQKPFLIS